MRAWAAAGDDGARRSTTRSRRWSITSARRCSAPRWCSAWARSPRRCCRRARGPAGGDWGTRTKPRLFTPLALTTGGAVITFIAYIAFNGRCGSTASTTAGRSRARVDGIYPWWRIDGSWQWSAQLGARESRAGGRGGRAGAGGAAAGCGAASRCWSPGWLRGVGAGRRSCCRGLGADRDLRCPQAPALRGQPELVRALLHRGDHRRQVLVEVDAELLGDAAHLVAVDGRRRTTASSASS